MKKLATVLSLTFILLISCETDNDPVTLPTQNQFLVDKVFDSNNNLLAEYFYNENNQLIRRMDTDPVNNKSSNYDLEYDNNRVSKLIYTDHTFPQFSHTMSIHYNELGQIFKDETFKNGNLIGERHYVYYPDGRLMGLTNQNDVQYVTFLYNGTDNFDQVKFVGSGTNLMDDGDNEDQYFGYKYDTGLKPNFGIHNLPQFEPLPYFGSEATFAKTLSQNNMIESIESGTKWIYQYNENQLPKTIEVLWAGVETVEPVMWHIKYKKTE